MHHAHSAHPRLARWTERAWYAVSAIGVALFVALCVDGVLGYTALDFDRAGAILLAIGVAFCGDAFLLCVVAGVATYAL